MCKRFFLLLASALLIGIGTRAFAASTTLVDISGTSYETAFSFLQSRGVVQGYTDGTGRPYNMLNRAEALKVIALSEKKLSKRVEWYQDNMPPLPLFSDVNQNDWYAPYVEALFEAGILQGYPDGTFRGSRPLSVEEAVTLLMRTTEGLDEGNSAKLSPYISNQSNVWFTPFINTAIQRNLIMKQQMLRMGNAITRGQFFDIVYRQMFINESGDKIFEETEPPVIVYQNNSSSSSSTSTSSNGTPIYVPQPSSTPSTSNPNASEKYFAISMPTLGIHDLAVNHPEDPFSQQGVLSPLQHGIGHLFSYPGGGGKIMMYGHSSGYPWDVSEYTKIFRKVSELNRGDKIYITYSGELYTYEVTFEQTIDAKDTSPFNDNGSGEELILYTCWPPDSIAQRYLVHARKIETVALSE
ncbi:sortase [Candidatus Peregrinibacteria bacterium]|jgi:LPXTG-site transpeptidase (sortase) family protein|nr:sortase [Candidatus Peregrinibacteria bacterium]MBT3598304.1 sortase [Candidatus Peregrinibacteria bacterium]MBT4367617.1 sortase [Candidatus Peregrinibacteria bacterium]MBT6730833.1 sortase [Candidatus Peregrinibacteria bacterium]MBT7008926.1 sortase [Candidatus Peregrinibacteria bacterium]